MMDRPKMHIWGPNRTQKKIFVDELADYESRGWRDHPNKVGLPLPERPVVEKKAEQVAEAGGGPKASINALSEGKDNPKRAYKRTK